MESGRIRYYGDTATADKIGEMQGRRMVREWDPKTDQKRQWMETLDHSGKTRIVHPKPPLRADNHLVFDENGNYTGRRK